MQDEVGALDAGELGLDARHEAAVAAHEATEARARELADAEREAERERSTWAARADALAVGLNRKDGSAAVLAAGSQLPGVLGSVAALLRIQPGYEPAIAAALGVVADAVAVSAVTDAVQVLELLKTQDGGRAGLLVGGTDAGRQRATRPLPPDAGWAADVVTAPAALQGPVAAALHDVVVVPDLAAAATLVTDHPDLIAVTRDGDVLGARWSIGGSASAPSAIEINAAVDEARQKAEEAAARHERLHGDLVAARDDATRLGTEVEAALTALHESDARLSAVAERLAELGQVARSAGAEAARLEQTRARIDQAREDDVAALAELEERLELAEAAADEPGEPDTSARDELQAQVAQARQTEMDGRLTVRTLEERVRAMHGRADQLLRAAEQERAARRREQEARERRARGAVVAAEVRDTAHRVLGRISASRSRPRSPPATPPRTSAPPATPSRWRSAPGSASSPTSWPPSPTPCTATRCCVPSSACGSSPWRSGRWRSTASRSRRCSPSTAPTSPARPAPSRPPSTSRPRERGEQVVAPQPGPFDRAVQEKRAARADRDLALLGKVNPLALEEFAALEERHQFLSTQLEDLKATRRDLLTVVKEVDDRILEVFTSAYHDVAREFEIVFATLFPGGEGRLVLTEPDDMLLTGIDVEARPPGKKVKRLSLLSGGERSLVAVALLVAIFRARPSPFYVMDEIEAALDDTNLGRLLDLVAQLRESSQIIQITHQKRTMEIADALYGVTMRGDGVTQVISQRLRDAV